MHMNEKKFLQAKIKAYGRVLIIHKNKIKNKAKKIRSKCLVQSIMPLNKTPLSITFKSVWSFNTPGSLVSDQASECLQYIAQHMIYRLQMWIAALNISTWHDLALSLYSRVVVFSRYIFTSILCRNYLQHRQWWFIHVYWPWDQMFEN